MMYREINRYMKLASYRKNYPKYQTGKKEGKNFFWRFGISGRFLFSIISNKFMNTVRDIRNASAHSNCLINKLFEELPATQQPDAEIKGDWSYDKTGRLYFFGV